MKFKGRYRIESARLKNWDYRSPGCYFVTLCTKNNVPYFGEINQELLVYSDMGLIAINRVSTGDMDSTVHMGNVNPLPATTSCGQTGGATRKYNPMIYNASLAKIIRHYKARVTFEINRMIPVKGFSWQAGFYDRIIRDQDELYAVRRYIRHNPGGLMAKT